ncbi:hypothetical protein PAAG_02607 [Paracoccidioides lutzii Pb01]|uniref:A-kinase anchor protein 7-like phosphoesterase domain-containing protein n=1 Tax=Paracoccidioides lutzii (strain ATCC MYA-826 / Pb01) TaxID=502779 RepID=C1GVR2_PARBA|nr:hypothetical protein PAAG_02607 [Paracoccidioides lutzii Pb01]EEH40631.1 hypothetical protein PAAG_02607 [Paracoccidioides lutzii Pb01]
MPRRSSNYQHRARQPPQSQSSSSRTRKTHFLSLPLVNQTSIAQLASSLAEFKDAIPLRPLPVSARLPDRPLVPDAALKPLGTLHLTLGVMSLSTKERLEEALQFLKSLDLEAMLRDVESQTKSQAKTAGTRAKAETVMGAAADAPVEPFIINLTSLHALPNARAATVLYANPVDCTARLYPFCVSLRNKFINAGFMEQEIIKGGASPPKNEAGSPGTKDICESDGEGKQGDDRNEDKQVAAQTSSQRKRRPRPFLLHATVVNTVHVPHSQRGEGKRREMFKFDARDLLMEFGNYAPAAEDADPEGRDQMHILSQSRDKSVAGQEGKDPGRQKANLAKSREKPVFVWAKNILIDRVCICELGAKPVAEDRANDGAVLGAAYICVGERSLNFASREGEGDTNGGRDGSEDEDGDGDSRDSRESDDGGVSVV